MGSRRARPARAASLQLACKGLWRRWATECGCTSDAKQGIAAAYCNPRVSPKTQNPQLTRSITAREHVTTEWRFSSLSAFPPNTRPAALLRQSEQKTAQSNHAQPTREGRRLPPPCQPSAVDTAPRSTAFSAAEYRVSRNKSLRRAEPSCRRPNARNVEPPLGEKRRPARSAVSCRVPGPFSCSVRAAR